MEIYTKLKNVEIIYRHENLLELAECLSDSCALIMAKDADSLMYDMLEEKKPGSTYSVFTEIENIPEEYESISYIRYELNTFVSITRFLDETAIVRVIKNNGSLLAELIQNKVKGYL